MEDKPKFVNRLEECPGSARLFERLRDNAINACKRAMMLHNPITEEIRETRRRLAAQFDNDVRRIGAEIRRRQAASGRRIVRLPPRKPIVNAPLRSASQQPNRAS
jgi:hypothetical protein